MTLKILDNDNNGEDNDSQSEILEISKQVLESSFFLKIN